ncbi:hypothetical protein KDJ56_04210 [Brevibacillus composti]|uniref:ABC-2 type transport system permease protein n=1 Tax=Brevibacillus composti TaxID=2796470 RepID=A0A7T5EM96_9BACL|nr:hypothetical protein [Brevibacillus composti]QQE75143.1 hypothetical protein JD108_04210 [Brevibacillus composti]QUO42231.1 hypothetical protein KDJ56_04210 [Brevibacillus composti]
MSKTWKLAIVLARNGGNLWGGRGKEGWRKALLLLLVAIGLFPMMSGYVVFLSALYDGLQAYGQEAVLLGLGLAIASLAIFLLGIFYVLSVFYYSQDIQHLLPLPLKPSQIIGAKFAVTLLYEYITEVFLLAPLLITYGVKSGGGFFYYLHALIIFLVLPVIPLALASIVAMLFMRFTNIGKSKDRFRLAAGLIGILIAVGAQVVLQRGVHQLERADQIERLFLAGNNSLLGIVTQMFPSSRLGAVALTEGGTWAGLGNLGLFLLLSAAFGAVFLYAGERLYLKGVLGVTEIAARRKRATAAEFTRMTARQSAFRAYVAKEWKLLFRTPAFLLNCVLSAFLMPLFLFIPLAANSKGVSGMAELGVMLQADQAAGIGVAILFAGSLFIASTSSISSTAISREGQGFFVNKFLPVRPSVIILAKTVPGISLSLMSLLILLAMLAFTVKPPVTFLLFSLAASVPGVLFVNLIGICIDLNMPKLNWDAEQKAVKQNMNTLYSLIPALVSAGLSVLAAVWSGAGGGVVAGVIFALFLLADAMLLQMLLKKGPVWLDKIGG